MSRLVEFHLGLAGDHLGRFIYDIWAFDAFWLEHDHKYIQWLFPIETSSKFNVHAPVLSYEDAAYFSDSVEMKANQQKSLALMCGFFGIDIDGDNFRPSANLNKRDHIWLKRGGHNHLRISRIIRSLALCGQPDIAHRFLDAVTSIAEEQGVVDDESKRYWSQAINREFTWLT